MTHRRAPLRTALALLLSAGALLGVVGCSRGSGQQFATDGTGTAETTASADASASQAATGQLEGAPGATSGAKGESGGSAASGGSSPGLSAKDARSLDAELSAIQSELDRLSVPSDSDFDSIGSGLE